MRSERITNAKDPVTYQNKFSSLRILSRSDDYSLLCIGALQFYLLFSKTLWNQQTEEGGGMITDFLPFDATPKSKGQNKLCSFGMNCCKKAKDLDNSQL